MGFRIVETATPYKIARRLQGRARLQAEGPGDQGVDDATLACYLYVTGSGVVQKPKDDSAPPAVEDEEQEEQEDEEQQDEEQQDDEEDEIDALLQIPPRPPLLRDPSIKLSKQKIGGGQGMNNRGIFLGKVDQKLVVVKDASPEEARVLHKVQHPSVIGLVAYDAVTGRMAMEPMLCSVKDLKRDCAENEPLLRGILRGATTGMLAMHGQGVAHEASLDDAVEFGREHPFYKDLLQLRVGLISLRRGFAPKKDAPYDPDAEQAYAEPDPGRPTFESFVTCLDNLLKGGVYDAEKARRLLRHPWLKEDEGDLDALNGLIAAKREALDAKLEKAEEDLATALSGADLYAQEMQDLLENFYRDGMSGQKMYDTESP